MDNNVFKPQIIIKYDETEFGIIETNAANFYLNIFNKRCSTDTYIYLYDTDNIFLYSTLQNTFILITQPWGRKVINLIKNSCRGANEK